MAYTTLDEVKAMFRKITISASGTAVIESEVTTWISQVDATIDAKIDPYYETPVTGTESLKILAMISTYKVAHIIKTVLEINEQNSDKNQEVQTNLDKKADQMIDDILPKWNKKTGRYERPIMPLPDATERDFSPKTASVTSSQGGDPTFTKGGDNW